MVGSRCECEPVHRCDERSTGALQRATRWQRCLDLTVVVSWPHRSLFDDCHSQVLAVDVVVIGTSGVATPGVQRRGLEVLSAESSLRLVRQ